jgi:hypothetical protein
VALTFDGTTKIIQFGITDTSISAAQIYSRWKDWVATGTNAKYQQAFNTVGGDPLGGSIFITPYFFLTNGWKLRPYPHDHTLVISENLLTEDNSSPFSFPSGGFAIEVVRQFALKTETVDGSGNPLDTVLESSMTAAQMLRVIYAYVANPATGLNSNIQTIYKSIDGSKNRIVGTVNDSGTRTITSVDGT